MKKIFITVAILISTFLFGSAQQLPNKNIVVVFIPPAVLAGDPPINIKKTVKIVEDSVNPV